MAIEKINFSYPKGSLQSVYDNETFTALELASKTSKKVDECVQLVNGVEQTAIEATAIVEDMHLIQQNFVNDNSDTRGQLVADNQNFIENLNLNKESFINDLTNSKNVFIEEMNTEKNTFIEDISESKIIFENVMTSEIDSIVANADKTIETNVNSKIDVLVGDGTIESLINDVLLLDIKQEIVDTNSKLDNLYQIDVKDYSVKDELLENTYNIDVDKLELEVNKDNVNKILFTPNTIFKISKTLTINSPNIVIEIPSNTKVIATFYDKTVFKIMKQNCSIEGSGIIESPPVWVPKESGFFWEYGIIVVEANNCTIRDITLNNVPRVGVALVDINHVNIDNLKIYGNMPSNPYETGHFGIVVDGGSTYPQGDIKIVNCYISRMKEGILCTSWGEGKSYGVVIASNTFNECYDHAVYVGVQSSFITVSNNIIIDCFSPLAISGKGHIVTGNNIYNLGSLVITENAESISGRDNVGCIITNNTIKTQMKPNGVAINLSQLAGTNVSENIISNNYIETGSNNVIAIRLSNGASENIVFDNNIIDSNIIVGKCRANFGLITVSAGTNGNVGTNNKITNNTLKIVGSDAGGLGAWLYHQRNIEFKGNTLVIMFNSDTPKTIKALRLEHVTFSKLSLNTLYCNNGNGDKLTLVGIDEATGSNSNMFDYNDIDFNSPQLVNQVPFSVVSTTVRGNRISRDELMGVASIASGNSNVSITNKNITTKTFIFITPLNTQSGIKGYYVECFNGYATIRTKDGTVSESEAQYKFLIM